MLEAQARAGWELYLRHPWMLQVSASRSVLGPNETMVFELALRVVSGIGLRGREMVAAASLAVCNRGACQPENGYSPIFCS